MLPHKVAAIKRFVSDLKDFRAAVKADAIAMFEKIPVAVLSNERRLSAYLTELMTTLVMRHLMKDAKTPQPKVAGIVGRYVREMSKNVAV